MKTRKKIFMGIAFFGAVSLLLGLAHKASALSASDWNGASYAIVSKSEIDATLSNGTVYKFTDQDAGDSQLNFKSDDPIFCGDSRLTSSGGKGITIATGSTSPIVSQIDVKFTKGTSKDCSAEPSPQDEYKDTIQVYDPNSIYSTGGTACPTSGCPAGTGPGSATAASGASSCESSSNLGIEWLVCPVIRFIDGMVTTFYGFVNDQLCFGAGTSITAGNQSCGGNLLTPEVESAWSLFRVIASSVLVIIMLVMVLSQALNMGIFDAYTIKKLLPKLVIATILIQISWFLAKFAIDLSNDLGRGIAQLMYAPFGGADAVNSIDTALGNIGSTGTLAAGTLFIGLIVLIAFSAISLGGIFLLALTGLAAVFVGFMVLFIRKILILFCVILMPIALVAWILPGTERFWNQWKDTFTKLLLMFPMIAGLIAAGRIFARVAGSSSHSVAALFAVLLGFFGPLFLLPKTYQWGGQALGSIGGAVVNGTKGIRGKPKEFGLKQAGSNREQRAAARNERLSYGRGRRFDRLYAAAGGFGLNRQNQAIRDARNLAEGRETGEKAVAQAIVGSTYEALDHQKKLESLDNLAQGEFDKATGLSGDNPAMQRWAMDQLAQFGDWDRIDALRTSGNVDERTWQAFVAKNISGINQQAPHLSPIRRDMAQLGYQEYSTWKDHSFHELERQVTSGTKRTADGAGWEYVDDPADQRRLAIDNASRALDDDRVRANLSNDAIQSLTRISKLDSPDVSVIRRPGGGPPVVRVPSGRMIQSDTVAKAAVNNALVSQDKGAVTNRPEVVGAITGRLANPNIAVNDPERQAMEGYLMEFRTQAHSSGSADASRAYNEILGSWQTQLATRGQAAEKAALSEGLPGTEIAKRRADAEAKSNAELGRIQSSGLVPLP